jgi:hypothetical protein
VARCAAILLLTGDNEQVIVMTSLSQIYNSCSMVFCVFFVYFNSEEITDCSTVRDQNLEQNRKRKDEKNITQHTVA